MAFEQLRDPGKNASGLPNPQSAVRVLKNTPFYFILIIFEALAADTGGFNPFRMVLLDEIDDMLLGMIDVDDHISGDFLTTQITLINHVFIIVQIQSGAINKK